MGSYNASKSGGVLLAVLDKVSIVGNLKRRGLESEALSDLCLHCGGERESIAHMYVHLKFYFVKGVISMRCFVVFSQFLGWLSAGLGFDSFLRVVVVH